MTLQADVLSPNALGAILTEKSIAALKTPIVAGVASRMWKRSSTAGANSRDSTVV